MNMLIIICSVLLNAFAQLLIRKGMLTIGKLSFTNFVENLLPIITNFWLWGAIVSFAGSIILWTIALSRCEVSYAYPFNAIGYVIVAILGYVLFDEHINLVRIIGIIVICIGVIIISKS